MAPITCSHLDQIRDVKPSAAGCEECIKLKAQWVHLRMCMSCGHVGCCDASKNMHATCNQALSGNRPSDHQVLEPRRELALVLCGREIPESQQTVTLRLAMSS